MAPADSTNEENKRSLAAQKLKAVRLRFAQKLHGAGQSEETIEENEAEGLNEPFDPANDGTSAASDSAEASSDEQGDHEVDDSHHFMASTDEEEDEDEGNLDSKEEKQQNAPDASGMDTDGQTTGDIEHGKALAGRMDRQKALDEQSKESQTAEPSAGEKKPTDNVDNNNNGADDSSANNRGAAQSTDQERARDLQRERRTAGVEDQKTAQPAPKTGAGNEGQPDLTKVGMIHNFQRLFKKCTSCTGCIGTIFRLLLDYLGAFYVYVFLDSLIKEENTDRAFTGAYCLTMLAQLLILLSPILIAIALASAAGYLLNGLVDFNTILNFIK
jgi:hypothetical protein